MSVCEYMHACVCVCVCVWFISVCVCAHVRGVYPPPTHICICVNMCVSVSIVVDVLTDC